MSESRVNLATTNCDVGMSRKSEKFWLIKVVKWAKREGGGGGGERRSGGEREENCTSK